MSQLLAGLALGLAAGIAPGPLQTLVVTSTLDRGFGAGWRVAVAPLFTDTPIVILSIVALSAVPADFLNTLAVIGGVFLIGTGFWTLYRKPTESVEEEAGMSDYWKGIAVNLLSPHPWVFWVTAGGPLVVSAWRESAAQAVAFLAGFYLLLVGSKVLLAWVVAKTRERLSATWRWRLLVVGGALLVAGGLYLLIEGLAGGFD